MRNANFDLKSIEGGSVRIANNASIWYIVKWIREIALLSSEDTRIKEIAATLCRQPYSAEQAIFDYVWKKVVFRDDPEGIQQIRTAVNSLREGKGNCVDYCVLISALLINCGIPHKFRFVWYKSPVWYENFARRKNWIHIYVVTMDGKILDPVLNQRQDGTDTYTNREKGLFNMERRYAGAKELIVFK